jgi:hypothetical protein
MEPPSLAGEPRQVDQRPIEVGDPNNAIIVRAQGHSQVSVFLGEAELAREAGGEAEASFFVPPGSYVVSTDGSLQSVEAVSRTVLANPFDLHDLAAAAPLELAADTADRHVADGVGEIRADGTSFCTITVTGPPGTDEVFLRSTGGKIMDVAGEGRIRSVRPDSDRSRKLVTVYAFTADPLLRGELHIEFV